jgi:hypothetical protein
MNFDEMIWSYSRVNAYATCPRMFYLTYGGDVTERGQENAFSQFGSLIHHYIEEILKGKMTREEAANSYSLNFEGKVTKKFPRMFSCNLRDRYYQQGFMYLSFFKFPYKVEAIEQEFVVDIKGNKLKGFIDCICSYQGKLIVLDHKSKSEIKPTETEAYFRQLYLYSVYVEQKYKESPVGLVLNLFRANNMVKELFSKEQQEKAINWFTGTIDLIKTDTEFKCGKVKSKDFFCKNLCSVRKDCKQKRVPKQKVSKEPKPKVIKEPKPKVIKEPKQKTPKQTKKKGGK